MSVRFGQEDTQLIADIFLHSVRILLSSTNNKGDVYEKTNHTD